MHIFKENRFLGYTQTRKVYFQDKEQKLQYMSDDLVRNNRFCPPAGAIIEFTGPSQHLCMKM